MEQKGCTYLHTNRCAHAQCVNKWMAEEQQRIMVGLYLCFAQFLYILLAFEQNAPKK